MSTQIKLKDDISIQHESIQVDMRDSLTTPHSDPTNPFAFTPDQLAALQDPKNIELLHTFGGLEGVAKGLQADVHHGLTPNTTHQQHISLKDVTSDASKLTVVHTPSEIHEKPQLKKSATFLSTQERHSLFSQRVSVFGANTLPPVKAKNIFQLMWMAFQDKTLILLSVAAVVSLAVGIYEDIAVPEYDAQGNKIAGVKWVEGVAIIVAILIVVLVGSVNDFQKEKQFRKLNAKKDDRVVKATREGQTIQISVYDIQVGDVLHLEPGDIVAADGIYIEGHNVRCDESAATGESDAVRKQPFEACYRLMHTEEEKNTQFLSVPHTNDAAAAASSSSSMLSSVEKSTVVDHHKSYPDPFIISGSKVLEGVCTYLVTGVGVNSYHGRTMMALRTDNETTPLQEKLNGLAGMIAKLGSAVGLLMLIVLLIRYFVNWKFDGIPTVATEIVQSVMGILIVVVTIVVVAVPEGLPLAVTLALAYATQRMLKDNNLVRVLAACETMGNATTVCSDKTGTLTQNKMTVVVGTLGSSFRFIQDPPSNRVDLIDIQAVAQKVPNPILRLVHQGIAVNSTAFESTDEDGQKQFVGNKTETALLQFGKTTGSEPFETLRTQWPVEQVFPFSSERKAMVTIIRMPHPTEQGRFVYRAHVKGASEILVQNCREILTLNAAKYKSSEDIKTRPFTQEDRHRIERIIQSYATRSLRTLGLAYRDFDSWPPKNGHAKTVGTETEVPYEDIIEGQGLTLIGIVGIEDPLRPGVKEAVKACQRAGVFIRMVTGDNVVTAKSIAKQCGIYTPGGIVMEGPVFRNLPPSQMDAILPRLQVLARSSPEDKQILVGRLRELGDIVAVTGDGTNDGPALKLADVGFSMGIAGTEVAKEASSIILMDDNFSSIVKAIMWGRCVNDSVKKFLEFQITVNITAVILTFVSAVASHSQKSVLTAVQLLWVNLIMDTFAALALATDPPTEELLERGPESRSSPLITFKMWKMIIGQAIFQIVVTIVLLYSDVLHYESDDPILQTIVFNTFVFCQIFNEINCRRIDSKLNVFHNILANRFFMFIFVFCIALQCIIVNFGGTAFQVVRIDGVGWAISIVVGLLALPIGVVIRLIPDEVFGFVFMFNPKARQRYLGGSHEQASPSVYVAGNERVAWHGPTYEKQQVEMDEAVPAYSPPIIDMKETAFEEQNQDTVLSSGSLDSIQRNH
ncbi:PMCA-type calcium-translocating P-type ATPase [Gilbertella persicaria]|uniref:PMCA-type calcium-translocating P-type ATPase n=1 Tax=Gilbertella persicaria TaxID=101096 RepID=UPI00221F1A31|nr:PMCA-type calcium-translocating P-type ATPase [Gilbertella persicaria]KAI8057559.1 PMCA-type calcium-translocating P-type ATPase [Gilbertella persicaria]